jgi:uncharacterized membrane protein
MIRVLYLGDSTWEKFAYLACAFETNAIEYEWYPEDQLPSITLDLLNKYDVLCLSDCGANRIGQSGLIAIEEFVRDEGGVIMFGGWETFQGIKWRGEILGSYHGTPVENCLPVYISEEEDNFDSYHGYIMIKKQEHDILREFDWSDAPTIGGFNEVTPKEGSQTLLAIREIMTQGTDRVEEINLDEKENPLLVIGTYGDGRGIAFTCDPTIHGVGPFVDWGKPTIVTLRNGTTRQLGENYVKLITNMIKWAAKKN